MSIEIKVPVLPESVADALVSTWYKKPGEAVKRDEHLVDIETDKVVLEVVAPADGSLETIIKSTGSTVKAQEVIALFKEGATVAATSPTPVVSQTPVAESTTALPRPEVSTTAPLQTPVASPAARQLMSEKNIDLQQVSPDPHGRIKKEDVMKSTAANTTTETIKTQQLKSPETPKVNTTPGKRLDRRVPMTPLRARIAERLIDAQQTAAILTTFNEINMQQVIALRQKYKESFEKSYGVRLGFMSFFTLAVIEALKHFPSINASIDGQDIVYHDYYDIGIAVSTSRGLVVPILRNAETLTMADIEKQIADLAHRAQIGKLTMEEITGGTFTITNGGVFGSLMATPILNPPQSGILGMHKVLERPIAENGAVVIRPMMYVAFSYDHRIIDGSESVRFLVMVKELLEDPARLALGI